MVWGRGVRVGLQEAGVPPRPPSCPYSSATPQAWLTLSFVTFWSRAVIRNQLQESGCPRPVRVGVGAEGLVWPCLGGGTLMAAELFPHRSREAGGQRECLTWGQGMDNKPRAGQ